MKDPIPGGASRTRELLSPRSKGSEKEAPFLEWRDEGFRPNLWAGGSTGVSPPYTVCLCKGFIPWEMGKLLSGSGYIFCSMDSRM